MFRLKGVTTHSATTSVGGKLPSSQIREFASSPLVLNSCTKIPFSGRLHVPPSAVMMNLTHWNKEFKLAAYNRSCTAIQLNLHCAALSSKRVFAIQKQPQPEEEEVEGTPLEHVQFSFIKSVLTHTLFALLVAGAVIGIANTEQAQEWNQKRLQRARKARKEAKPTDSALTVWWRKIGDSGKTIGALISVNAAVYLLWQQPYLYQFMIRHFLHTPANFRVSPMLLSVFSHKSALHLLFNMYGLYLFGWHVHEVVGREQFLAIYIAGGMSASLFSHLFKLGVRDPIPSLGASGAIFSIVAASAYFDPYTRMQFVFFPFMNFSKEQLVLGMALFDFCGLIGMAFKKHLFNLDHAAHLGGVAFGWMYCNWLLPKRPSLGSKRRT